MVRYSIPIPKTKKMDFGNVFKFKKKDTTYELKNLTIKRKQVEDSINRTFHGVEAVVREDLVRIEEYLPSLQNLIDNLNKPCNREINSRFIKALKIRWSSALNLHCKPSSGLSLTSILKSPIFFQVCSIMFELHMVLFIYALKLREKAIALVSTDMVESAKAYREAAGVFDHLSKLGHPDYSTWVPIEKFPELTSSVCSSLGLLCLAEGQAVTANKAKEKGKSANLLAKLHYGVSQFVAEANASLLSKTNIQAKELSSRFLDYVSTLGALHELKSEKHLAESLESEGQVGEAIGVLRRALARAKKTTQSRDETWKCMFNNERGQVTEVMNRYERLNKSMMLQRIPLEAELPNPQGDKIVTLIPYLLIKKGKELNFELS